MKIKTFSASVSLWSTSTEHEVTYDGSTLTVANIPPGVVMQVLARLEGDAGQTMPSLSLDALGKLVEGAARIDAAKNPDPMGLTADGKSDPDAADDSVTMTIAVPAAKRKKKAESLAVPTLTTNGQHTVPTAAANILPPKAYASPPGFEEPRQGNTYTGNVCGAKQKGDASKLCGAPLHRTASGVSCVEGHDNAPELTQAQYDKSEADAVAAAKAVEEADDEIPFGGAESKSYDLEVLRKAEKLKDVVLHLLNHGVSQDKLAAECEALKNEVPILSKIGEAFSVRIPRVLIVMGLAAPVGDA